MHFNSLRFKLTLWYVFILGILLISFSSFLYFTLSKSLYRDVDNKLRSLAELIATESASPLSRFGFGNIDQALDVIKEVKKKALAAKNIDCDRIIILWDEND